MKIIFKKKPLKRQGQLLPRSLTKHKPSIEFLGKSPYYTIVMVGPDDRLQWMVINVCPVGPGHTVMPYKGPGLNSRSSIHLYSHGHPIRVGAFRRRSHFSLDKFVGRRGLVDAGSFMFQT